MNSDQANTPAAVIAPFIGFMLGCILFGCTLLQAYQYFRNYMHDTRSRKMIAAVVCLLDAIELLFSANMIYFSVLDPQNRPEKSLLWTLKGSATTTALLNLIVQSYYLSVIWRFVSNSILAPKLINAIRKLCLLIFLYALALIEASLLHGWSVCPCERVSDSFSNLSEKFERVIYIWFGSSAVIDTGNGVVLSSLLFKTSPQGDQGFKSRGVVRFLVLFFVGTGMLTTISAIASMFVCAKRPTSALYLAIEFCRPRLLANSILAMFNSKATLRQRMEATSELRMPSELLFGDEPNDSTTSGSVVAEEAPAPSS